MKREERKKRIREYRESALPAGLYRIRNTADGRMLVGAAVNPEGRLNRHRFQLRMGSHPVGELQAAWNELGQDAFEFGVVDTLEPRDEPSDDPREELDALMELWLEKLGREGAALYGRSE